MENYKSAKRFSNNNDTGMTAMQLKEQLDSIGLPEREPQLLTTYDIFGSNEDKYQPSEFLPDGDNNAPFANDLEYAGSHVAFKNLVKALAKKLTTGTAKPQLAIAYGEYFTYLGEVLTQSEARLEAARKETDSYRSDKAEFDAIKETYRDQLKYEQRLSEFDWKTVELEEQQVNQNAQLIAKNTLLEDELEAVKSKQGKLSAIVQKFMKSDTTKGEAK